MEDKMTLQEAKEILWSRAKWQILESRKYLGQFKHLNSTYENKILEACNLALDNWKEFRNLDLEIEMGERENAINNNRTRL